MRIATSRSVAGLLAIAMTAAAPAAAHATIVPGSGIGGVTLGQSQTQVRQYLGAPHQLYCWSGSGASCRWQEANYLQSGASARPVEQILFSRSGRVVDLLTSRGSQRTRAGVAVGSSQHALRRAYPTAPCASGECVLITHRGRSAVVTTFFLSGAEVSAIEVSQADTISLTVSSGSATIAVTDPVGDPELGAIPELTVTVSHGYRVGSITPLGGVETGRYSVQISGSKRGPVTVTATFHWGPPALRNVLGISTSTLLRQL